MRSFIISVLWTTLGLFSSATLILAAEDDPVVPVKMFHRADLSPSIELLITKYGGHVAHIAKSKGSDPDRWWMDWRVVNWLRAQSTGS